MPSNPLNTQASPAEISTIPAADDWQGWIDLLCQEDDGTINCVPAVMRDQDLLISVGPDGRLNNPDLLPGTPYGVAKFLGIGRLRPPWALRAEQIDEPPRVARPTGAEAPDGSPFVYMIQSGDGPIKIGLSTDPRSRLRGLQTGHPYDLIMRCTVRGGSELEAAYHRRFAEHRLRGEWFEPHPDILAEIERLQAGGE